ncbi:MAG: L-aspartate oxidase [bacterium]|nr:L-aspartate oxidase [bacterium]
MTNTIKTDIVIAGTGVGGLFCALHIPEDKNIILITKSELEECDSYLAQGGICMLKSDEDYESYFEDTLRAGHYENNRESVDIMIRESQKIIGELVDYGVDFERNADGSFMFTKEGAHSTPRILFHEDITGHEITSKLLAAVKKLPNVTIIEKLTMVDIVENEGRCIGIIGRYEDNSMVEIKADYTVFATGGIGGLYKQSTNYPHLTGDALAISLKHGVELLNIDYIQIHPTTLYSTKKGRCFLISESVRGEGAILFNSHMERFIDELQPRDVVAQAILEQMKKDGKPYVWLSMKPIPKDEILSHFPNIYERCMEEGYDVTKECIPVVPAQHYFMGGIKVDSRARTSMPHLYAVGETACNGVHGKNRLASNSLLESLVWAKNAALDIISNYEENGYTPETDLKPYRRCDKNYKKEILSEIEREKMSHE